MRALVSLLGILILIVACKNSDKQLEFTNQNIEYKKDETISNKLAIYESHCGSCHSISTNTVAQSIQNIYRDVEYDSFYLFTYSHLDSLSKKKVLLSDDVTQIQHPGSKDISSETLEIIIDYIRTSTLPIF